MKIYYKELIIHKVNKFRILKSTLLSNWISLNRKGLNKLKKRIDEKEKEYRLRSLPEELWDAFVNICEREGFGRPRRILKGGDSE